MAIVYHASPHKNLKVIVPQKTLSNDEYIGDFVFATADKHLAIMYLATKGLATLMNVQGELRIVICSDEKTYINNDMGGAVYELSADTFTESPQAGLEDYEYVSKDKIRPLSSKVYDKSLDAIVETGVNVYFVDAQTFDRLVAAKDEEKILSKLQKFSA